VSFKNNGKKSTFNYKGDLCAATTFYPEGEASHLPGILMIHGWGGIQMVLFQDFIRHFNNAGFAVMTFDFPGWGDSAGWPRNTINPWERVRVADAALSHMKSNERIDSDRIVAWGTSFGGGHAIDLAANHPELAAVVAHVPMLNGMAAVKAVPVTRMLRFSVDIAQDLLNPFGRKYLPVVSPEGEYSTMDRDGAQRISDWVDEHMDGKYDNRVTAASLLTMGWYQPHRNLKHLKIPTLIIGALRDTVAPFNEEAVRRQVGGNTIIETIDANHFDPYLPPYVNDNVARQLKFLNEVIATRHES